jgi:hypothetical protein
MNEIPTDLVSASKAAKLCDVHVSSVYRWILAGKLPAWKRANGRVFVRMVDLRALFVPQQPEVKVSSEQRARLDMYEEANRNGLNSDHLFRHNGRRHPGPPAA